MDRSQWKRNGVYRISFAGSDAVYIGSTARGFRNRRSSHINALRKGKHPNRHLQHAYNLFGLTNFEMSVLEEVDDLATLLTREQYWIDTMRVQGRLYNILPLAGRTKGRQGRPRTDAEKQHLSDKLTGRKLTAEHAEHVRNARRTPEARKRASEQYTGRKMPDSARQKLSLRMRGNTYCRGKARRVYDGFLDPNGNEYRSIANLGRFAEEHGLERKPLVELDAGRTLSYRGWQRITPIRARQRSNVFAFVSPEGALYEHITNLKTFCQEHGLWLSSMSLVYAGKKPQHRGWRRIDNPEVGKYNFIAPDGTRHENIIDLTAFCEQHKLGYRYMQGVFSGQYTHYHGWTRIDTDRSLLKRRAFIAPDGTIYKDIYNLKVFAKEHGLTAANLRAVHMGERPHHKGWRKAD